MDFHNSNQAAEMAQILQNIQERFVPSADVGDNKEIMEKVNTLADTQFEQIKGIQTSFADWHLGKNLLMVSKIV